MKTKAMKVRGSVKKGDFHYPIRIVKPKKFLVEALREQVFLIWQEPLECYMPDNQGFFKLVDIKDGKPVFELQETLSEDYNQVMSETVFNGLVSAAKKEHKKLTKRRLVRDSYMKELFQSSVGYVKSKLKS